MKDKVKEAKEAREKEVESFMNQYDEIVREKDVLLAEKESELAELSECLQKQPANIPAISRTEDEETFRSKPKARKTKTAP